MNRACLRNSAHYRQDKSPATVLSGMLNLVSNALISECGRMMALLSRQRMESHIMARTADRGAKKLKFLLVTLEMGAPFLNDHHAARLNEVVAKAANKLFVSSEKLLGTLDVPARLLLFRNCHSLAEEDLLLRFLESDVVDSFTASTLQLLDDLKRSQNNEDQLIDVDMGDSDDDGDPFAENTQNSRSRGARMRV